MKKLLLLLMAATMISHFGIGQTMLTRRQVYDFDINDEFHSRVSNAPPNAIRIKITGKSFSVTNDTVYYTYSYTNFSSVFSNPTLTYSYFSGTGTWTYNELDTLINAQFRNPGTCIRNYDTLYTNSQFCGALTYHHFPDDTCLFESVYHEYTFGKGLGKINDHNVNYTAWPNAIDDETYLFYYKKSTGICGTPDTTMAPLSVMELSLQKQIPSLYPNPASGLLHVENITRQTTITLYDVIGALVLSTTWNTDTAVIDISQLANGVYTVVTEDVLGKDCHKLMVANP